MVKEKRHPGTPIKVCDTAARTGPVPFSTPFSAEIINVPHYGEVKMPTVDHYDGMVDLEEYLGVCKAQMYVQDVDDAAYCRFFPASLKAVPQS